MSFTRTVRLVAANSKTVGSSRANISHLTVVVVTPMKMLWCWRCKAEVPMLDDDEWRRVSSLFHTGTERNPRKRMYAPALREYERITGFHEANPNVR